MERKKKPISEPSMPKLPSPCDITAPIRLASSAHLRWSELLVAAYLEPSRMDGFLETGYTNLHLMLMTGGILEAETRHPQSAWRSLRMYPGDIRLTAPGSELTEWHWKALSSASIQNLHIYLDKDFLQQIKEEMIGSQPFYEPEESAAFRDPFILQMGLTLQQVLYESDPPPQLYIHSIAQALATHIVRCHFLSGSRAKQQSFKPAARQIQQAVNFMLDCLDHDLSIDMVARQTGFSPTYFARLFHQIMGETPHQFVLRHRLERAEQLLSTTDLPLQSIAQRCGFVDQSHLNRVFKRRRGITPRTYRQR
jgi:AraC family transcriptional regulator